jgi:DNA-binding response OmpR family regulator
LMGFALRAQGHTVIEVAEGKTAADLISHQPFDVLITDLVMPKIDGLELLWAAKEQRTYPPIIATTGLLVEDAMYLKVAEALGARVTLAKPFTAKALVEAVENVLRSPM